jgi:hypothetical protein
MGDIKDKRERYGSTQPGKSDDPGGAGIGAFFAQVDTHFAVITRLERAIQ